MLAIRKEIYPVRPEPAEPVLSDRSPFDQTQGERSRRERPSRRAIRYLRITVSCLLFAVSLTGCGPHWKQKFIRKGKPVQTQQPILTLQSDIQATDPPEVRYQEHFAYWKSWHSELLDSLGQIRKRDLRYFSGMISELQSMAQLLSGPPADRLGEILVELHKLEKDWSESNPTGSPPPAVRTRLAQIEREIDKNFHPSKVKDSISKQ